MRIALATCSIALVILFTSFSKPAKKLFTPPSVVAVNDSLYFDQAEISNKEWKEFAAYAGQKYGKDSENYKKALPDTMVWREDPLEDNEPYMRYYYEHPAYGDYPLVGITYEQAQAFCKWKTGQMRQEMKAGKYGNKVLPKSIYYRLPTKEEWENAASAGFDEKALKSMQRYHYLIPFNMVVEGPATDSTHYKANPNATLTAPVLMYPPNKLGIYNIFGNVAEMTSEKGISKGGSWKDKESEATVEKDYPYEAATAWLGFRCVCVVQW